MVEQMLAGAYDNAALFHVRMNFSRDLNSVGRIRLRKLAELLSVLFRIVWNRLRYEADVLYFPPAGPSLVPVMRDIVLLSLTRWMFRITIFHFHAGGLNEIYAKLPRPLKYFFRVAYWKPEVVIRLSPHAPNDGDFLQAKRQVLIPNGIPDQAEPLLCHTSQEQGPSRLLYVGSLREDKGLMVLLKACCDLRKRGADFQLNCVGDFSSNDFRNAVMEFVSISGLSSSVFFPGILTGTEKNHQFAQAEIFCFPSFYNSEVFPLALLEALSFALPIVATSWRGIPDIVGDSGAAFLVPIRNESAVAEQLTKLIEDPILRRRMGVAGREHFLRHFTLRRHYGHLQELFDSLHNADLN